MGRFNRGLFLLFFLSAALTAGRAQVSSGIADIDEMRQEVTASPTTATNALARVAILDSWFRLLLYQGFDMSAFAEVRPALGHGTPKNEAAYRAIDRGYSILEQIQSHPVRIENKTAPQITPAITSATDWPMFHGGPAQVGYSPDPGPQTGQLAWRFPIGHSWYAAPAIDDGRVYIASPGMTTLAYALDETTGRLLWKTRQDGIVLYGAPRASSSVVSLKDKLIIRASSGSWEEQPPPKYLFFVDKQTGKVTKQFDAGIVDYRRGYAPVEGNGEYVVYPASRMDIRNMPASVGMLDTIVVRKAATGDIWWTFRAGDMFSEPVVTTDAVFLGTEQGMLYSLNLPGAERARWSTRIDGAVRTTPAVDGSTLYVAGNNGKIYAFDIATGKQLWTFTTPARENRAFQFFSRPTIGSGRVYIGAADKTLYCLDANNGALLWKYALSDWVRSRPAAVGDTVYVGTLDGTITAIQTTGSPRLLWSRKVAEHELLADLVAGEHSVLVSDSGLWLTCLNPQDGYVRWRHKLLESARINGELFMADRISAGSDYQSPPTAVAGVVYVGGPDRFVHALDANNGKELWRFETSGQVSASPIVVDGKVCFGQQGGDKDFYCVAQKDGRPVWKQAIGWGWVSAGYAGGKLFVGTVEGDVLALDVRDGSILWVHRTNGGVYPAPATDEQNVYTGSWDGYYYALDQNTGAVKWAYATPGWDYSRGGGPDSAAPILWKNWVIARVFPATLAAIDRKTGKVAWEFRAPHREIMNATAAAHEGRIFVPVVAYLDGAPMGATLFALDDRTGKIIWQFQGAGGWPGPSLARDRVCVGSSADPFFVCVDPKGSGDGTTSLLWRYRTGGIFEESVPAIYGDKAFVLCTDNYLYAFQ